MKYTEQQKRYIDSVDGAAHQHAVNVIGIMEQALLAQSKLLIAYRIGSHKAPREKIIPESTFKALVDAREIGIKV